MRSIKSHDFFDTKFHGVPILKQNTESHHAASGSIARDEVHGLLQRRVCEQVTIGAFCAITWAIWNARNHSIFRHEAFDEYTCLEMFWYHFSCWVKKALGDTALSIVDISRCLGYVSTPPQHMSPSFHISWSLPPFGTIKVNINGSFNGSNGQSGIGRIFRDDLGTSLLHFGKQIVADLTNHAEILAIKEELLIVVASRQARTTTFILE